MLTPAEVAWVALVPCALVAVVAILLLGPPLGHALARPSGDALWPPTWWEAAGRPEPVEQGRVALALLAPFGLAAAVAASVRRPLRLRPAIADALVVAGHAALVALLVAAVAGQRSLPAEYGPWQGFDDAMLVVAAALVAAGLLAMRLPGAPAAVARFARERRALRLACGVAAVVVAGAWLLETVGSDRLVEQAGASNWTLTDAFAVLSGRDPLVDYRLLYAKLLPYPGALTLLAFGKTGFVYSLYLTTLSLLALLAVYAILRRVTRSSPLALGLFVPFVAVTDMHRSLVIPGVWPMRYAGAYLVAWLTARHLDGAGPRRRWVVFLAAGLAAINQLEFGFAALLASVAALLWARPPRTARDALRLAGAVAGGAALAVVAVSALTLVRAGSLPKPDLLLEWPRIFSRLGLLSLPMPTTGMHLAIYATFAGALAVATVRAVRGDDGVLLTSMLAWSGTFGLLAGAYFAGRSDESKLTGMLSAWGLALALLAVVCVRALSARRWRAPTTAELLVLFGFALAVTSIGRLRSPVAEARRLADSPSLPAPRYRPTVERLIASRVAPGEKVAILLPESFRIAYELRVENVSPYQHQNAVVTRRQLRTLLDAIEREQVREVFLPAPGAMLLGEGDTAPEQVQAFQDAGFATGANEAGVLELRRP
ncbi:MAG TPA: hypothetical protein VF250_16590 [Conexibacter sp.]